MLVVEQAQVCTSNHCGRNTPEVRAPTLLPGLRAGEQVGRISLPPYLSLIYVLTCVPDNHRLVFSVCPPLSDKLTGQAPTSGHSQGRHEI